MKKLITILFFALIGLNNIHAATFVSKASGNWSATTTWSITVGTDADGIPDLDDDVTINAAHTIGLISAAESAKSILNNGSIQGNGKKLNLFGNFNNNGNVSGIAFLYIQAASVFSSSVNFNGAATWWITKSLTISAGTSMSATGLVVYSTVTNLGSVNAQGGLSMSAVGKWINGAASTLSLSANSSTIGVLDASAIGNTVTYVGTQSKQIKTATYYNLTLLGASTIRTALANLIVLNDLTIGSGTGHIFSMGNFNLTIGGNWLNQSGSNVTNQGTITFNGSGTQTITRTGSNEVVNNMSLTGTGTTLLNCNLTISQNLSISSGAFDVSASSFSVNIGGNLINNGSINTRTGTFTMNGGAAQTISGSSNTSFYNLTLINASGLTINSPQSLSNVLTVSSGNFNSNGNFTLLSDASTTARIAPVSGSFTGTMIIQKFISTRVKGWHDLSSPVQSTTINDWDNEMYMSGIGAYDGVVGPAGVDGYTAAHFNSVNTYAEPTAKYVAVSGSSTPLPVGKGYEIWLADDQTNWYAKVIDTRGVPNFGTQVISCSFAGPGSAKGYNLIGNPFGSAITFSACTRTRVNANILLLDGSGNVTSYGANATIPSHQGFWVIANGASASISIPESAKSTDITTSHYRKIEDYGIKLLFSTPMLPYYNENTINFESAATLGFDNDLDAPYIKSPIMSAPAMFMINKENDSQMITNTIGTDADEVTIPLGYYTPVEGVYYIQPNILSSNGYNYIWIENIKTGEKFDLNSSSIALKGKENETNTDYVLRLSKSSNNSVQSQTAFANDLTVFNIENSVNIKANNTDHTLSQLSIYDLSGKLVMKQERLLVEAGNIISVDISYLAKGMYVVNITDEQGNNISKKIIK